MEQKLFTVSVGRNIYGDADEFPPKLKDLLNDGWKIVQMSAFSVGNYPYCVLLLQRELIDKETQ